MQANTVTSRHPKAYFYSRNKNERRQEMNNQNNTGYGYMIVRVTTARGAIPLKGATVTISNNDPEFEKGRGDIIAVFTTNSSGLTERFALPAPPRELSMSPDNGKSYESYNLGVAKEGYYTHHRQGEDGDDWCAQQLALYQGHRGMAQ